MMASYNGFAALFFKLRFPKVQYLLTLQEGDPIKYIKKRTGLFYPIFKKIFTKADFIQTISNYLSGYAKEMGYRGKIEVVPNGVDVKHFSQKYSDIEISKLKEKLGKKENTKYIITTSRLVVKNAAGNIIEALVYLPENVELLILGTGYQLKELQALAKSKKVSARVHFLGFVPHEEMPKYVQISDVFVRPSLSEGFGNSFIEAMAANIPVVATPVGGIPDFLKDGETGLFCKINDPKSIATRVVTLLGDDKNNKHNELRNSIILRARKMVEEKYDWNTIAHDMHQKVFNQFTKGGNPVSTSSTQSHYLESQLSAQSTK
jgi:glycosyltransferase involved in cell wall biosynthesis